MSADKWSGLQVAAEARMMALRELVLSLHAEAEELNASANTYGGWCIHLSGLMVEAADAIEWLLEGQPRD